MDMYCLEFDGSEERIVTIHKLSCANIDHGSLLGMGRLTALGTYTSFFSALSSAKILHATAEPCLDCCMTDAAPVSTAHRKTLLLVEEDFNGHAKKKEVESRQFPY